MPTHTTNAAGKILNFDRSKPDPRALLEVGDENGNTLRLSMDEAEEFRKMTGKDPLDSDILSPEVFDELIEWLREEGLLEQEKTDPRESMIAPPISQRMQERYRKAAKETYHRQGEIEIDDNAIVSHSDEGAYVQAWVWISNDDLIPNPTF